MKLSVKSIGGLRIGAGKRERIIFDDDVPGFGIRLRDGGTKNWVYQYKLGNQQRRITFGSVTAMGVADAREQAEQFHAQVKLGRDPAGEKIEATAKAAETFGALLPRFLERQRARLKPRSFEEVQRHLVAHGKPLHGRPIEAIDRRANADRR